MTSPVYSSERINRKHLFTFACPVPDTGDSETDMVSITRAQINPLKDLLIYTRAHDIREIKECGPQNAFSPTNDSDLNLLVIEGSYG